MNTGIIFLIEEFSYIFNFKKVTFDHPDPSIFTVLTC
jgi:homogentisate 1,2-dioxygenase